jgi:hypothetical protein
LRFPSQPPDLVRVSRCRPPENNHQLRTNIETHVRNALGAQFGNATVIAAEIIGTGAGAVVRIKFNNVPDDGTTLLKAALR